MKIALKVRFVISFILLLQIISYSAIAQSKKEQISILNYQLDSLKQNVLKKQLLKNFCLMKKLFLIMLVLNFQQ